MSSAFEDKKQALLIATAEIVARHGLPALDAFTQALYARAAAEDLATYSPASLAAQAEAAFERLRRREPGRHRVTLVDPPDTGETIIEIVNDDMPFLVDSVMGELAETGCDIHLVLHPTLAVGRDAAGTLTALKPSSNALPGSGLTRESFIQINVGRIASPAWRNALGSRLDRMLGEVRQAVVDWRAMLGRIDDVIATWRRAPPPISPDEIGEAIGFLEWLRDDNFIFLGTRDYRRTEAGATEPVAGGGLGVLRNPEIRVLRRGGESLNDTTEMRDFLASSQPLIVTKSNVRSVIHRRVPMDYIGVKIMDAAGQLTGELRIVGLFTSTAYTRSTRTIPYVRHKVDGIVARTGFEPKGHSGKALMNVLENLPRDELFQIDADTLHDYALQIMALEERPRIRVLARRDTFDRFVSVLVHVPRERYTTAIRGRIGDYLESAYSGRVTFAQPTFLEGGIARIQFIVSRQDEAMPAVPQETLEASVTGLLRTWADTLVTAFGAAPAAEHEVLADRYSRAFSAAYQEAYSPDIALRDARRIEGLSDARRVGIDFHDRPADGESRLGLKLYQLDAPVPLSDRVPVLENMGLRVIDERTYRIEPASRPPVYLHDMTLEPARPGFTLDNPTDNRFEALFMAVWRGLAENDGFNRLVLATALGWREIALLRALTRYLRQIGLTYTQDYVAEALLRNTDLAVQLVQLFAARHDPDRPEDGRAEAEARIRAEIESGLEAVASLDDDTILRRLANLVGATLRTNLYQLDTNGQPRETFAFKIDSRAVTDLPAPKPFREIWVYAPRVEGVHLRFARAARGGIRWSDRPQDFRTEVLGLVKAQQVKNAVIVPAGAKGGFVPKYLKPGMARDAWMAEGTEAYSIFIAALLTVTDNLKGRDVVPPPRVVRHDDDDPYLVVAADKGTATFSDLANGIAMEAGFWLGDAFASGGSAGYDHKGMGITARGAFEAVKRHFREMDVDVLKTPITTVGVGDMSGDVFGNGLLLSPTLRLVAAFDHRDIFLDPAPDLDAALAERHRLFRLPRSSWADYDRAQISKGGGVFSRASKAIDLSPEIRAVLGFDKARATPAEVMRAILKAPADLLWFGGIGTYVRGPSETDAEAGDRANDAIRIESGELRVKIVGEGANLGMTQQARIAYGLNGGRCNSDAIDNSAGVNCSDVEVNIKIGLGGAIEAGDLAVPDRNPLLAEMTDEVARLVLANNISQTLAIGTEWTLGLSELPRQQRLMDRLAAAGRLDRAVEVLPDDATLARRAAGGQPLTRSEIGVLLAYAKMALKEALLAGPLPDDPWFAAELAAYFPMQMRARYAGAITHHRLRREIVATRLANAVIDRGGTTFVSRLMDETGTDEAAAAHAFVLADAVFGFGRLTAEIDAATALPAETAAAAHHRIRTALVTAANWAIRNVAAATPLADAITRFAAPVADLSASIETILSADAAEHRRGETARLAGMGLPEPAARALALLGDVIELTDIRLVAEATGAEPASTARLFFAAAERLGLDSLHRVATRAVIADRYDAQVLQRAIGMVDDAHRSAAAAALSRPDGLEGWLAERETALARLKSAVDEIALAPHPSVSAVSVAAGLLSDIVRT